MKKTILLLIVTVITSVAFAFKKAAPVSFKLKTYDASWSRWESSGSYPGIEHRTRKASFNDVAKKWQWDIQFRNTYSQTATFSYGYSSTISGCKTDHMEYQLPAGKESDVSSFLSYESSTIWICIDKVKMSDR